jgi:hypothetical protein
MKNYTYLLLFAFFVMLSASCKKVLEKDPESTFSPANFYKTSNDAIAATNAVYDPIMNNNMYLQIMWVYQDQSTDDAEWGNGRNTANQAKNDLDKYTFTPATVYFYSNWTTAYQAINRANAVISRIPAINMDATLKSRLIGEAKFLRAFYYFALVRLYGKVPLVLTETTGLSGLSVTRSPVEDVYKQIISDFTDAENSLPLTYGAADKGRATQGSAKAFLASVYLTTQVWDKAAAKAKEVIDLEAGGTYGLWDNYADIFLVANKNGKESIFEGQALGGGFGEGSTMDGYLRPTFDRGGFGDDPPTQNLYNAFSSTDKRRDVTLKLYSATSTPAAPATIAFPCYVAKYKDPSSTGNGDGSNNFPIMRYAEILLIYAEALNESGGDKQTIINTINRIRNRAGIPPLTTALSKEEIRDAILVERRLELAFEGHRRYDLIRTGRLVSALKAQNPSINVKPENMLLPIPQSERDVNVALDQNLGY